MKKLFKFVFVIGMIAFMAGNPSPGVANDVGTNAVPFDQETIKPFTVDVISVNAFEVENFGVYAYTNEMEFQVNHMEIKIERSWPAKAEHSTVIESLQPDVGSLYAEQSSWCPKELFFPPTFFVCPIYRC